MKGGEHVWDKRYKDPVTKSPFQPLDENGKFKMGKYEGKMYNTVPKSYVSWVLNNWTNLSSRHKRKLSEYLNN